MGGYLRTLRERRGWTQAELADRSGVPQASISRLETMAPVRPSVEPRDRLAAALGVESSALRFGPPRRRRRRRRRRPAEPGAQATP